MTTNHMLKAILDFPKQFNFKLVIKNGRCLKKAKQNPEAVPIIEQLKKSL